MPSNSRYIVMTDQERADMTDKICLITGATDGIGRVTARELGKLGWTLILVSRNAQKGEQVARDLRAECGNEDIVFKQADLSLQQDVRRVAQDVAETYDRLDVLINNAGAIFWKPQKTAEGIEKTFALNHLNYFLLTNLLLDRLRAAPSARIVNVASIAHVGAEIDFDDLECTKAYKTFRKGWTAYQRSKLANIMFTAALARRLEGSGVTANSLHPGFVRSRFGKDNGGWFALMLGIGMRFGAIAVEKGAETPIYLASSDAVAGVSGRYFADCGERKPKVPARYKAEQERLWELSETMTRQSA
jgi:NAD(P)-dependent dehydrogenase (short-subunit alcohol dehydrogenase family)